MKSTAPFSRQAQLSEGSFPPMMQPPSTEDSEEFFAPRTREIFADRTEPRIESDRNRQTFWAQPKSLSPKETNQGAHIS